MQSRGARGVGGGGRGRTHLPLAHIGAIAPRAEVPQEKLYNNRKLWINCNCRSACTGLSTSLAPSTCHTMDATRPRAHRAQKQQKHSRLTSTVVRTSHQAPATHADVRRLRLPLLGRQEPRPASHHLESDCWPGRLVVVCVTLATVARSVRNAVLVAFFSARRAACAVLASALRWRFSSADSPFGRASP